MVQLDTRLPMMIQQPNVLAALDAGTQAAANQASVMRQAEGQNLFRQYGPGAARGDQNALNALAAFDPGMAMGLQSERLNQQATGLRMEFTREQISAARRQAAEAAQSQQDAATAAAELAKGKQMMTLAGQAYLLAQNGDPRAQELWSRVTQEFDMPELPMNEGSLRFLDAIVGGFDEGLSGIIPKQPETTTEMQNLQWRAQQAGLKPGTPEYKDFMARGGSRSEPLVNIGQGVQIVDEKRGVVAIPDTNSPTGFRFENVPGGEADREARAAETKGNQAAGMAETSSDVVLSAAERARAADQQRMMTGALGALASYNPSSPNAEVYRQVQVLQSMAAAENINAMRRASPTGGALGNASDADILLLKQKSGALDPASPNFARDLADYERTLLETIHGREEGRRIFDQTRKVRPVQQPAQSRRDANPANRSSNGPMSYQGMTRQQLLDNVPTTEEEAAEWNRRFDELEAAGQ